MSEMVEREPTITMWYGRRLEDLSREDLIKAVLELGKWNATLIKGATDDRLMFGRIMKSARR